MTDGSRCIVEVWRNDDGTWQALALDGAEDSIGSSAEQVLSDIGDWLDQNPALTGGDDD